MKTFEQYLAEAPATPMPPAGADPSGGMPPPPGGGLPPPPMGGGMGGMGGPPGGGLGGPPPGGSDQPVPVKTIKIDDIWEDLDKAADDMDKYEQLNVKFFDKNSKWKPSEPTNSSLVS